jgi:hypothetical protein
LSNAVIVEVTRTLSLLGANQEHYFVALIISD